VEFLEDAQHLLGLARDCVQLGKRWSVSIPSSLPKAMETEEIDPREQSIANENFYQTYWTNMDCFLAPKAMDLAEQLRALPDAEIPWSTRVLRDAVGYVEEKVLKLADFRVVQDPLSRFDHSLVELEQATEILAETIRDIDIKQRDSAAPGTQTTVVVPAKPPSAGDKVDGEPEPDALAALPPVVPTDSQPAPAPPDTPQDLVTLNQAAAAVSRTKRALEHYKTKRGEKRLPDPTVEGGGGKPDLWEWKTIRPWLVRNFGVKLPETSFANRTR
jgi:hypothetical protein